MSTVRVHHVTPDHRASTSGIIFGAEINAFLDAGTVLIDPGRLAVDPDLLGDDLRALPYLTLRRHGLRIFLRRPLPDCVPSASHGLLQADLPIGNGRGAAGKSRHLRCRRGVSGGAGARPAPPDSRPLSDFRLRALRAAADVCRPRGAVRATDHPADRAHRQGGYGRMSSRAT